VRSLLFVGKYVATLNPPHAIKKIKKIGGDKLESTQGEQPLSDIKVARKPQKGLWTCLSPTCVIYNCSIEGRGVYHKKLSRGQPSFSTPPCAHRFSARSLTAAFGAFSVSPLSKSPLSINPFKHRIARRNTYSLRFIGHGLSTKDHSTRAIAFIPPWVYEIGFQVQRARIARRHQSY